MTPALALLLKAPRRGTVKTRLAATLGPDRALAIHRALAERQVAALPADWPGLIHFTPADADAEMRAWLGPRDYVPQPPGDLGARIASALAAGFASGARAVIALGGDCPALDTTLLRRAARDLAAPGVDAVLGPAADGGYYLIGLRRPCPELFRGVAWSTPAVLAETRARLKDVGLAWRELPELRDVDDEMDWRAAIAAGLLPAPPAAGADGE